MATSTVRAPGRPARSSRDTPGPADGSPERPPARTPRRPRFIPPQRYRDPARIRRSALLLSALLHVVLLVVLIMTDAVRLPDLASLLDEPEAPPRGGIL